MPSVLLPSSYSTLAQYGQKRPLVSVEELRARQRNDLFSHRRTLAQDRIINRRKSFVIEQQADNIFWAGCQQFQQERELQVLVELESRLTDVHISICNNPNLACEILADNWRTLIDGLSSSSYQHIVASTDLIASVDIDIQCLKSLIKFGLLYQLQKLFSEHGSQRQMISIALLNHLISKVPASIPFIVDMMDTHKMFVVFEEILDFGTREMIGLILHFYNICLNALISIRDLSSAPLSPHRYTTNDTSFQSTMRKLITLGTVKSLIRASFGKGNRSQSDTVAVGISIFSGILSTLTRVQSYEWFQWHSEILGEIRRVPDKLISNVKRQMRRNERRGFVTGTNFAELQQTYSSFRDFVLYYDAQIDMNLSTYSPQH